MFVPQRVRADPPPVELPRDLRRRLVEAGELTGDELPAEFDQHDRDLLAKAREAHTAETPRPVAELLGDPRHRHVVLLGDPGAGKSSLLRYVALSLAGEAVPGELVALAGHLPVVVELRSYASLGWRTGRWSDGTLLDFLDYLYTQQGLGLPRDALQAYLTGDGRAVVMFDGLDEMFDPAQREDTTQRIVAFARQFPLARIVVTSRVIGYRRQLLDSAGFSLHTLQDLDDGEIAAFVERWYAIAARGDADGARDRTSRLLAALERSPSARDLAGNPMLLTILAVIGRRRELPKERHRVYQHAVEVLTQHWDLNRAVRDTRLDMDYIDEEDKRELLRRIARRMQGGRDGVAGNHIHRDELLTEFQDYLQERYPQPPAQAKVVAKAMLEQFRDRNFILSRFGPGLYGFVHRAFLEYCCADEIVYRFKETRELTAAELVTDVFAQNATDPAWQEVLLLVAGMIHDRFLAMIIDRLLALDETPQARFADDGGGRHWLLALRCLAEARNPARLPEQGQRIVARLIELVSAIRLDGSTVESIDGDPTVVEQAMPALREVGAQLATRAYLDWFGRSPRAYLPGVLYKGAFVRGGTIRAFANLSTEIAAIQFPGDAALRSILERRIVLEYWPADVAAFDSLYRSWTGGAGHESLRRLVVAAERDEIRNAAITALARDPEGVGIRHLITERATVDRDDSVRLTAVECAAGWPDDGTRTLLTDRLALDPASEVRAAALMALAAQWPADVTRGIVEASAASDRQSEVRQAALTALAGTWPDDVSRSLTLVRAGNDPSADVRSHAVELLAQKWPGDTARRMIIERSTADTDDAVRVAALKSLAQTWPDDRTRMLVESGASADLSSDVRTAALESLAEGWPDEQARAVLNDRATTDLSEDVRETALEHALRLWPDEASRVLAVAATTDPNEDIRRIALDALAASWSDEGTRRLLISAVRSDPDNAVRTAAVGTLARVWPDEDTLTLLLDRGAVDAEWTVRQSVVDALGERWRDDRVRAALIERALTDPDNRVRHSALHAAVKGWPDERARSLLTDHAHADENEDNRIGALTTLLFGWPDAATRALLLRSARDDNEDVRAYALCALAERWPDDEVRALVLELAASDPHEDVRFEACADLSSAWPDPTSCELIGRAAVSDPDADVRELCIHALAAGWPDGDTRRLLVRRTSEDDTGNVREAAAKVLVRRWPDAETRTVLTGMLARDAAADVRRAALEAVIRCWPDADSCRLAREVARNDPDADVRERAVEAVFLLSGLGDDGRRLMLELAEVDLDAKVRNLAMAILAWAWPGTDTRELISDRLRDRPDEDIRSGLLDHLAAMWHDDECRELIEIIVGSRNQRSRKEAVEVLAGNWPDATTTELLAERAVSDIDADVRRAALSALVRLRSDRVTRAVVVDRAVFDADEDLREEALQSLLRYWPDDATREILAAQVVFDDDADVRGVAVRALVRGWPNHPETRRALVDSLAVGCTDEQYERDIADAVAQIWPDHETRALLTDLATSSDASATLRAAAARAMAWRWPDTASRDIITSLATADPDERARVGGVQAMARHWPDARTRALLEDSLADPSPDVRTAGTKALSLLWPGDGTAAVLAGAAETEGDDVTGRG
ncbi:HEAT repeat domain-containing protein [Pseudonocardia cypriaca]|uniref:HEAT repeat protein n=1 Tax=Pseudonocardia cypriaca TaxID=882449 RepID=A0A543FRL1_9PSEU|nr:HEAT repeat domain-containing protein [Pseudonocardia cypriaca]TQM36468.1 HEAT repeat protein [Pseudonocardia cypriaca]